MIGWVSGSLGSGSRRVRAASVVTGLLGCLACTSTASAASDNYLSVFAGTGAAAAASAGPALSSALDRPRGMAVDPATGDLYIADYGNSEVEQVTPQGTLSIIAGDADYGAPTPGSATSSALGNPTGVAVDPNGDVYIADPFNNVVEEVTPQGTLSIVAGTGTAGAPTPGPATQSDLHEPYGVAVNRSTGNLYIADYDNSEVEQVTPQGTLSIIAGDGSDGAPTPGSAATSSALGNPSAVAVDPNGDVYIADPFNNVVEEVTPQGTLTIVAGTGPAGAPTSGPAMQSALNLPHGVAVDPATGDLYIADYGNSEIEQVTPQGTLSIVAGTGTAGPSTPGLATQSQLDEPLGVGVNAGTGELYIADTLNNEIEQVGPAPAPVNLSPPAVSGKTQPGQTLTATNGAWSYNPTAYLHQWQDCSRSGNECTDIVGATGSSYELTRSDVGHTIRVVVVATNAGGSQASPSAPTALVNTACPAASGRLTGDRLGPITLGMTRAKARRALPRHTTSKQIDRFCLSGGRGILAGYPSMRLLKTLTVRQRKRVSGRVVLVLTANRHYALNHIKAGTRVTRVRKRLAHSERFRIGGTTWYVLRGGRARAILKVRHGTVEEVGIANHALTATRTAQRQLLTGF